MLSNGNSQRQTTPSIFIQRLENWIFVHEIAKRDSTILGFFVTLFSVVRCHNYDDDAEVLNFILTRISVEKNACKSETK